MIGLLVNIAGAWILWSGHQGDGNLRGALLHVVGDLLGSAAAIVAAIGILWTGYTLLDPILSVLVSLLVIRSAAGLVSDAVRVLLQAMPSGMDGARVTSEIARLPGIANVGHFHAWTLTDARVVATVHVTPAEGADALSLPPRVAAWMLETYAIEHVTVQVDPPGRMTPAPHCAGAPTPATTEHRTRAQSEP